MIHSSLMRLSENRLKSRPSYVGLILLNVLYFLFSILTSGYRQVSAVFPFYPLLMFNVSWILTLMLLGRDTLLLKKDVTKKTGIFVVKLSFFSILCLLAYGLSVYVGFKSIDVVFYKNMLLFLVLGFITIYFIDTFMDSAGKKPGRSNRRVMLLGASENKTQLKSILLSNPGLACQYIPQADFRENQILTREKFTTTIIHSNVQFVFVEDRLLQAHPFSIKECCDMMGVELWVFPSVGSLYKKGSWNSIRKLDVRRVRQIPLMKRIELIGKRLFDVVFSFGVIVFILSWITPLLAIVIYKDSRGPVIFKQKRTGLNNKTFTCFKFRSMAVNDVADSKQACASDTRITKLGRRLRDSNLDELPQFFNVLLGDMSVVGPRPHMLKHTEMYTALIDNYLERHLVKPGITGLAQSNGWHGETDQLYKMEQRVKYDVFYIKKWYFWMDMTIIYKTIFKNKRMEPAFMD